MSAWPGAGRPDASMTLLREMTEHPLDPGYEAAARAGAREGAPGDRWHRVGRSALTLLLAVGLGVGVTSAVVALRRPGEAGARSTLIADIRTRTAQADANVRTAARLREQVDRLSRRDLAGDPDAPTPGRDLLVASGSTAVVGPGLRIVMDDAPGARSGPSGEARVVDPDDPRRVQDVDLREVVNGLWQAGAEAIAVNGQRLTGASAIRDAGGAILVDFRPLSPPYRIQAVGSPNALDAGFALTRGASWLQGLRQQVGITVSVTGATHLSLPAAEGQQLFTARVPAPAASTPLTGQGAG